MLIAGTVVGALVALALGGRPSNLLDVRLRAPILLFLAVIVRYGTELALRLGVVGVEQLRLPLFALSFAILLYGLWLNRDQPGLLVAATGIAANATVMIVNGGWMPVSASALGAAGMTVADLIPQFHRLMSDPVGLNVILQAAPLGDILPIPLPILRNVVSVGDVFLSVGLGWFVFATLMGRGARTAASTAAGTAASSAAAAPTARPAGATLTAPPAYPTFQTTYPGTATTGLGSEAFQAGAFQPGAFQPGRTAERGGVTPVLGHPRQQPLMRLALDPRFSAFWFGQTVSAFGDRIHQVALGVLVFGVTASPLATALVFLVAALPNLFLAPLAGTLVDRSDQRLTMIASDFLRAALVVTIPFAAAQDIWFVFPLVFVITCISVFFRAAKNAAVPRIVARDDLMAANSALWTSETLADLAGYPIAGLFVAVLGSALAIAFWADAASYLVSGVVILGIAIPPVVRVIAPAAAGLVRTILRELGDGLRFLRGQPTLWQNTLITALAQMSTGALIALALVYSAEVLDRSVIGYPANYTALETAIGVGNLVGGLAVGVIGNRFAKGWLVAVGLIVSGLGVVIIGLTASVWLAVGACVMTGVANLLYVVPTQTLFAELTPPGLMGRVVSFRSGLVYGSMTVGMGISGLLAQIMPVGWVLSAFGALTVACGMLALLLPAMRDA
ncbi:MAG: MFS transporter [Candidatus Limnocylindrales bacterium]